MQYFDINSLRREEMDEILTDQSVSLEGYLARRIAKAPRTPIKARSGTIQKRQMTHGRGQDALADDTRVAPGSETPKGEQFLDEMSFKCEYRKKAYGINDIVGMELAQAMPYWAEFSLDAAHDVLIGYERLLVALLKGTLDDSGNNSQEILTKTLATGAGVGGANILDTLDEIKRAGNFRRCVLGEDIAIAMSKNPKIIGAAGGSATDNTKVGFGAIANFLRDHFGITETIIGVQTYHDGARQFPFEHAHLHDGIMYFDNGSNLVKPTWIDLVYDEFEDKDREMKFVRAKLDATLVVEYKDNSLAVVNPKA